MKSHSWFWIPLLLTWGVYAIVGMLAPIDPASAAKFGLSTTQSYLLRVSFQLPIFLLWAALFYGTFRFYAYAKSVVESPEAAGFKSIARGLLVLIFGLVVPSYVGLVNQYNPGNTNIREIVTVINLYCSIGFSLIAFMFFLAGGRRLITLVPESFSLLRAWSTTGVVVGLFAVIYSYAVFHNPDRLVPTTPGVERPAYYLGSDLGIVLGAIIPYLIVWTTGLLSVMYIRHFTRFVSGVVYQKAFRAIGRGVISLVLVSVGLQLLGQAGALFVGVGITQILVIVYVLLAAIAVGYLFIAQGARELGRLESA